MSFLYTLSSSTPYSFLPIITGEDHLILQLSHIRSSAHRIQAPYNLAWSVLTLPARIVQNLFELAWMYKYSITITRDTFLVKFYQFDFDLISV